MMMVKTHIKLGMALALCLLLAGGQVWGATYNGITYTEVFYMCVGGDGSVPKDGTCAHAFDSTNFNNSANWSAASADAVDDVIGANDAVVFLNDGGAFTTALETRRAGAAGKPITLVGETGATVLLDGTGLDNILGVYHNYITVDGFSVKGGTAQGIYAWGQTGVTLKNLIGTGGVWPIMLRDSVSNTVQNISGTSVANQGLLRAVNGTNETITGVTCSSCAGEAVYIEDPVSVTLSDVTASNPGHAGVRIQLKNSSSVIGSNWTISGAGAAHTDIVDGIWIDGNSSTGCTLQLTNINLSTGYQYGLYIINAAFGSTSFIDTFDVHSNTANGINLNAVDTLIIRNGKAYTNGQDGIYALTSPAITTNNIIVYSNARDGISYAENSPNGIVKYNRVYGNGTADQVGNGDGITLHDGCTGALVIFNLVYSNKSSGMAFIGTSAGTAHHNTVVNNGDSGSANMGVRGGFYNSGSGAWVLKNNLFQGNYPVEVRITAGVLGASTFDYNAYNHTGNGVTEEEAFCVTDGGTNTFITWAAYQTAAAGYSAGDEAHSVYSTVGAKPNYAIPGNHAGADKGAPLYTYAAYPGWYGCTAGRDCIIYGKAPDIGAIERKVFLEDGDDMIWKKCKSSNTACYNAP